MASSKASKAKSRQEAGGGQNKGRGKRKYSMDDEEDISSGEGEGEDQTTSSDVSDMDDEVQPRSDDDDDNNESIALDDDTTINSKRKTRVRGNSLQKWRRLAVEEKELIMTEGGLIWHQARPILQGLRQKEQREAIGALKQILERIGPTLDATFVPQTASIPHAYKNVAIGNGSNSFASGQSLLGSLMSWRMERGDNIYDEENDIASELDRSDRSLANEARGYAADIALLETLLLPEAAEAVSLTKVLDEQAEQLEELRNRLETIKSSRAQSLGADAKVDQEVCVKYETFISG